MSYQSPPGDRDDAAARQPPGWYLDPIGHQALRWWDGAQWGQQTQPLPGRGREPQLWYPQQPYDEQPRQPSFTPDPQEGTPSGQSPYQSYTQYPGTPYEQHSSPQVQSYGQQHGRSPRTSWPQRHKVLTVLGGLVALIIIGSIASAAMGSGGSSGNATACSDYWSMKNNIDSDPAIAATGWHNLQAIASEITNSGLATAVGAFNEAMNNNDTTGASTASIAIGTACTSLGYNNPG